LTPPPRAATAAGPTPPRFFLVLELLTLFVGLPLLAVVMTSIGGLIFGWRYMKSRSLAAVSFEHALYGQLVFTIGLGRYFYHGAG